ncbi:MAG TPA: alpha-glucan family phosphorylase [Gemmatimonadaceae bacterium]|nr:alpha-glucan family phosphorylase [Gemmatimonadaceae bacterium]
MHELDNKTVAYFSMEICLEQRIPTYSGGLGVLAGDTLRSAADLEIPLVAVSLAHRKGYFHQSLDAQGQQTETPEEWRPEDVLEAAPARITVDIEGRTVHVRAWFYSVQGITGHTIPVLLLDTNLEENDAWDRTLTDVLYGGDQRYRLAQEMVLGMGGVAMLRALGFEHGVYHINEGHAALLTLVLLDRQLGSRVPWEAAAADFEAVRHQCIFTTHTPVPAGHDKFAEEQVVRSLGEHLAALLSATKCCDDDGSLNMTYLALRLSRYINGVAMRHRDVSREMFPAHPIDSITNGVHAVTWTSEPVRALFDRRIPEWRRDNLYLRYAVAIPLEDIREAHEAAKQAMIEEVQRRTGVTLDASAMTIGFARRATPYKRADMIFSDLDRLRAIVSANGPLQIVYGGKAHPRDEGGKALIRHIFEAAHQLEGAIRVVYLENYDIDLACKLTSGVDLWLNNPRKPLEASGTSGMKAALNGVPSLSVLDGWWFEGHIEGVTGWSIGGSAEPEPDETRESNDLYVKLEQVILPLFYGLPLAYVDVMRHAIALNGSFFNTQRMVQQYVRNAYFPAEGDSVPEDEEAVRS